jgi:hypothetical protein
MEQQMHKIVSEVFYDLQEALGEDLDAGSLADTIGDRMHDLSAEYRAMPYEQRHAIALRIAGKYC